MNEIMMKPKRRTSYYYDYMQEVRPWLIAQLPKADKKCVEKELWDAIQESTEGTHDATTYLVFESLESYLEDLDCVDKIMDLFRQLSDESDREGINVEISW